MKALIAILLAALLVTNALWAYAVIDYSVTVTYREDSFADECRALDHALAILPIVASERSKAEILAAAVSSLPGAEPFDKEGATWVGPLGFQFSGTGQLERVERGWSPSACEEP